MSVFVLAFSQRPLLYSNPVVVDAAIFDLVTEGVGEPNAAHPTAGHVHRDDSAVDDRCTLDAVLRSTAADV